MYVSYNGKEKREEKEVCGDCFKLRVAYLLELVRNVTENVVFFLNSLSPTMLKGKLFKDAPGHRITAHDWLWMFDTSPTWNLTNIGRPMGKGWSKSFGDNTPSVLRVWGAPCGSLIRAKRVSHSCHCSRCRSVLILSVGLSSFTPIKQRFSWCLLVMKQTCFVCGLPSVPETKSVDGKKIVE